MRNTITIFFFCLIAIQPDAFGQSTLILHNHIGYETEAPKHAVIRTETGKAIASFEIVDYISKEVVLSGTPQEIGKVDQWRNWYFYTVEFDDLDSQGQYFIRCHTSVETIQSFPFLVQDQILERNALSDIIFYFKTQRCTGLLDKADRNVEFSGKKEGQVDAHGGWMDATGDYGKHLSHLTYSTYFNPQQISLTSWGLFKTYQLLEERGDRAFRQYKRRLLDEAMHGADFLVRMKAPDGSFYRTVSGWGPEKKPEDRQITPTMVGFKLKEKKAEETDILTNTSSIPSNEENYEVGYRAGAGLSIAALAVASTYAVSGDYDNATYLKTAEETFAFLEENNSYFTNDGKENIVDDYCALIAATELFKATQKPSYKTAADERAKSLMNRLHSDQQYTNYWRANDDNRPFFHPSDAGLPVVALVNYLDIADNKYRVLECLKKSLEFELAITSEVNNPFGYSRQYVQDTTGYKRGSFFFPHNTETAPWWQGENARLGSMAAAARLAAPVLKETNPALAAKLEKFAWNQMNWVLGLNPFDACMLEGSGRNNVEYLFFNSFEYKNAPGGIVNGITAGLYNPNDIDLNRGYNETGKDNDWRWAEQWLPHATWFMIAIAANQ